VSNAVFIVQCALFAAVFLYVVYIVYLIAGWFNLPESRLLDNFEPSTSITILVAARNEEANIEACLSSLIQQDYPRQLFEIIVVDDLSEDNTAAAATKVLQHSEVEGSVANLAIGSGKKAAITEGVKRAKGELILVTDADCTVPKAWLSLVSAAFDQGNSDMIVMPVLYHMEGGAFHQIQHLEFLSLIGVTGASIGNGVPLLANGANLGFRKTAFEAVNGYEGNDGLSSGDDVFLLHKVKKLRPKNVLYLKDERVWAETSSVKTLKNFFQQRVRWAGKASAYTDGWAISVSYLVFFTNLLLLIGLVMWAFDLKMGVPLLLSFSVKCIIDFIFLFLVTSGFKRARLLFWLFPEELIYPFYVTIVAIWSRAGSTTWKGRRIK
jgi:biofilm PGA synthesis N-glycosyltransferase PgaC